MRWTLHTFRRVQTCTNRVLPLVHRLAGREQDETPATHTPTGRRSVVQYKVVMLTHTACLPFGTYVPFETARYLTHLHALHALHAADSPACTGPTFCACTGLFCRSTIRYTLPFPTIVVVVRTGSNAVRPFRTVTTYTRTTPHATQNTPTGRQFNAGRRTFRVTPHTAGSPDTPATLHAGQVGHELPGDCCVTALPPWTGSSR